MIPEYAGYLSFLIGFALGIIFAKMFSEGGKNA